MAAPRHRPSARRPGSAADAPSARAAGPLVVEAARALRAVPRRARRSWPCSPGSSRSSRPSGCGSTSSARSGCSGRCSRASGWRAASPGSARRCSCWPTSGSSSAPRPATPGCRATTEHRPAAARPPARLPGALRRRGARWSAAASCARDWQQVILWLHRSDFGVVDPLFHRDVGFFVFSLPLYQKVAHWLFLTVAIALASHVRRARRDRRDPHQARAGLGHAGGARPPARARRAPAPRHRLAAPARPVRARASASGGEAARRGVHRRARPCSPGCACSWWSRSPPRPCSSTGRCGGHGRCPRWPWSWWSPSPSSPTPRSCPRWSSASSSTPRPCRASVPISPTPSGSPSCAYGLDRVADRPLPANATISGAELRANRDVLRNIQLWDTDVLRPQIDQQQSIGSYYTLPQHHASTDTARHGEARAMIVAERELDLSRLEPSGRTWANDHLAYTHGYGLVAVPAGGVGPAGQPKFVTSEFGAGRAPDPGPPAPHLLRRPAARRAAVGDRQDEAARDREAASGRRSRARVPLRRRRRDLPRRIRCAARCSRCASAS